MTTTKTADVDGTLAQVYALAGAMEPTSSGSPATTSRRPRGWPRSCPAARCRSSPTSTSSTSSLWPPWRRGAGLRLNPGNIRKEEHIKTVAREAGTGVPIRVGVNAGSLDKDLSKQVRRRGSRGAGRVGADRDPLPRGRRLHRHQDLGQALQRSLHGRLLPAPLRDRRLPAPPRRHRGGSAPGGLIKSVAGIGTLLNEGIGDTIRFSLTADPSRRPRPAGMLLEYSACGSAKGSTSSPARRAAGPRWTSSTSPPAPRPPLEAANLPSRWR
jgi:(E)-4-hydroxy-3-methylbut-2-enyl-diphosphate synthase